jgi:hypothetical protein
MGNYPREYWKEDRMKKKNLRIKKNFKATKVWLLKEHRDLIINFNKYNKNKI